MTSDCKVNFDVMILFQRWENMVIKGHALTRAFDSTTTSIVLTFDVVMTSENKDNLSILY